MDRTPIVWTCLLITLFSGALFAEVVHLKNGGEVAGKITSRDGGVIVVEGNAGKKEIPESDIASIEERDDLLKDFRHRMRGIADTDADGVFVLSRWCDRKGLPDLKTTVLEWVIGVDPDHADARSALGYYKTADGKWVKGTPPREEADDRLIKALKLYRRGEDGKAIKLLEELLADHPNDLDATYILGDIYYTIEKNGHALRQFDAILKVDPNHAWALYGKALIATEGNKHVEAERLIKGAIAAARKFKPKSYRMTSEAEFYYVLGMCLKGQGESKRTDAEKALTEAVRRDRKHFRAFTELGVIHGQKGKYRDAYDMFSKAMQANGKYAPARFNWGIALYREGNLTAAMGKLFPLVRTSKPYVEALKVIGRCYHRQGQSRQAASYYENYLKKGGKDTRVNEWINEVKR